MYRSSVHHVASYMCPITEPILNRRMKPDVKMKIDPTNNTTTPTTSKEDPSTSSSPSSDSFDFGSLGFCSSIDEEGSAESWYSCDSNNATSACITTATTCTTGSWIRVQPVLVDDHHADLDLDLDLILDLDDEKVVSNLPVFKNRL